MPMPNQIKPFKTFLDRGGFGGGGLSSEEVSEVMEWRRSPFMEAKVPRMTLKWRFQECHVTAIS